MGPKTREQALAELDEKVACDREKLEREYDARERIGVDVSGYETPFIHYGKLYDTAGSVHFGRCNYQSIKTGKDPDTALLRALLAAHPPLPLVRYKRGTVSFRSLGGLTDDERDGGEVTPVFPVRFRVQLNWFNSSLTAKWEATLGDARWRFEVSFPAFGLVRRLGYPVARANRDDRGITSILEASWRSDVPGIQVTKYASGSFDAFPDLVLWWHEGVELDVAALLEIEQ